jgi:hypothetical protein
VTARRAQKHGLKGLMRRVSARGLHALDKRSAGYRALNVWRSELERDLGGKEHLSAMQLTLIEHAVRTRVYLDSMDDWLMAQSTIVASRRRAAVPALGQRMALQAALERILDRLGIERRDPPPPSLSEYLNQPAQTDEPSDGLPDESDEENISDAELAMLEGRDE